jgi:hypothetical protein
VGDYSRCGGCGLPTCTCRHSPGGFGVLLLIPSPGGLPCSLIEADLCNTCRGCLGNCDYATDDVIEDLKETLAYMESDT